MSKRHFMELYRARAAEGNAVCVGLDTDPSKIPPGDYRLLIEADKLDREKYRALAFNTQIVQATHELVCAYKPNAAFYEAAVAKGMESLDLTIRFIHQVAPDVPVILDAKRGDIDNTNIGYVISAFQSLQADAITVHPYLGRRSLTPFLDLPDKGVIVLCRTSNEEGGEFQDKLVLIDDPEEIAVLAELPGAVSHRLQGGGLLHLAPLYQDVAYRVSRHWNRLGNCALVVGATYPGELGLVRKIAPDMLLLIPGIGAQGGDIEATVRNGRDSKGQGMIINSSRGIIYAADPRAEAQKLDGLIRQFIAA